jgi:hypothetical protein
LHHIYPKGQYFASHVSKRAKFCTSFMQSDRILHLMYPKGQ